MDEIILGASIEYSNNENNDDHDGQNFINSQKGKKYTITHVVNI